MKRQLPAFFGVFGVAFLFAGTAFGGNAKNGQGTMAVAPNVVAAGSNTNFTFSFRGPSGNNYSYNSGSQATVLFPASWIAPQTNNSSSSGFVSVTPVLSQSTASIASISGSGPWTVTINFTTGQRNGGFNLAYNKVTAPTNGGVYTFTTKTKQNNGTLTSIKSGSPSVTVNSTNKINTTTSVISSLTPSVYGQSLTFTATVTSTNAVAPTGTVTFLDADVIIGTGTLDASGHATFSTNGFTVIDSPYSIIAQYNGDATFNGSISAAAQQDITQATLSVSGLTANDKTYDGNTTATLNTNSATLAGVISGDDVALDFSTTTATFADKNAGAGKAVTIGGLALTGVDAPNYLLTQPSAAARVTLRTLTVSATGIDKTYDGTATATVTLSDNRVSGDTLTTSYTSAAFVDQNAGSGKVVSVSGILVSGADSGNYTFNTSATTTASITPAPLTATANNTNRLFGASDPTFTANYSGFVAGETVAVLSGAPAFSTTANAASTVGGNPYTIIVTNGTLAAANYAFVFVNGQLTINAASSANAVSFSANPSPTGSNVTLRATLTAVAPASGVPSGTVQFLVNGTPLGAPASLSSGIAILTTTSLAHGTNTITAAYAGDGNFIGSTNSASLLINTAPTAQCANLTVAQNTPGNLSVSNLLTGCSDPDGDPLSLATLASVSTQGGVVSLNGSTITYTPPTNYVGADSFIYTVADNFGASSAGPVTVNVTVQAPAVGSPATLSLTRLAGGSMRINAAGNANATYHIQASTNLLNWVVISTNNADASGLFTFTDVNASQFKSRFYRTTSP